MRIKHWQGYGSVEAKVVSPLKDGVVVIKVSGNHECGTDFTYYQGKDKYTLTKWLLSKVLRKKVDEDKVEWFEAKENGSDATVYTVWLRA